MILHRLRLRYFRRFDREAEFEFSEGINLITGPNESGKTSLVLAVPFALFTPHRSGSAVRAVQPFGRSTLKPFIEMEIGLQGKRYRVTKDFGQPLSRLEEYNPADRAWRTLAEGPEADRWLAQQFEAGLSSRLRGFPTEWGLAQALWLVQFPGLEPAPVLRPTRLQKTHVQVSPQLQTLLTRLERALDEYLTPRDRRPRTGGPLRALLDEVASLRQSLQELEQILGEMAEHQRRLRALEQKQQEKTQALQDIEKRLEQVAREADRAEEIGRELEKLQFRLQPAEQQWQRLERLQQTVKKRIEAFRKARETAARLEADLLRARAELDHADQAVERLRQKVRKLRETQQDLQNERNELQRLRNYYLLQRQRQDLQEKLKTLARLERQIQEARERLQGFRSEELQQRLNDLRRAQETEREARARLEGLALRLTLEAQQDLQVLLPKETLELARGERVDIPAEPGLSLEIPGVLRLSLAASGQELRELQRQIQEAQKKQREILTSVEVGSLEELEALLQEVRRAEEDLRHLEQKRRDLPDRETLQQELLKLDRQLQGVAENLPDPEELDLRIRSLEQELRRVEGDLEQAEARLQEAEERQRAARERKENLQREKTEAEARQHALWQEIVEHLDQYWPPDRAPTPRDLDLALGALAEDLQAAQRTVEELRRRRRDLEQQLPEASLLQRLERLRRQQEDLRQELQDLREEYLRVETGLAVLRRQSPYRQEQQLRQRYEARREELRALQRRAEALLLLEHLARTQLQHRTRALDRHLARRVEELLHRITGAHRPVRVEENHWVVGFPEEAETRDDQTPDRVLSSGALEQFALALRLAYGLALAETGDRQMVVLDDALVFSDDERFERILGLLENLADRLQFLILTSHPERYTTLQAHRIDLGDL